MIFKVAIKVDNAAFEGHEAQELARILGEVIKQLEDERSAGYCRDYNGNIVGEFKLTD